MKSTLHLLIAYTLFSCTNQEPQKETHTTPSGIKYTIHHPKEPGKRARMMSTAKLNITKFNNDTPVPNRTPVYQMVLPPAPYTTDPIAEVLITGEIGEGDSVLTITKENHRTTFKVIKIFTPGENGMNTDSLMQVDKNAELKKLIDLESEKSGQRIQQYLKTKNINAQKTPGNAYTNIIQKGNGPKADSGTTAGIKFNIRELYSGKTINSNTDTAFHQPPILEFKPGTGFMLKPVENILSQLGRGGKAHIYVPAALAAGTRAADPSTNLENDIVFEIEVITVK